MTKDFSIYLGSIGSGVLFSEDSGRSFTQSKLDMNIAPWGPWIDVRTVEVSPHNSRHVLAGSHIGLHYSEDGGRTFEFISTPFDYKQVWAIAWHPSDPKTVFIGIAGWDTDFPMFRTRDGCKTWEQLPAFVARNTPPVGASHITKIAIDPTDHNTVWTSSEIWGFMVSHDCGDTWRKVPQFGNHVIYGDGHGIAVHAGKVYATVALGLFTSLDGGVTFSRYNFPDIFPVVSDSWNRSGALLKQELGMTQYMRHIRLHPTNPDTIFICTGDTTPGTIGAVQRSRDAGKTWEMCELPVQPNSHMNSVATHAAVPDVVVATSLYGQVFISQNAGDSWAKCGREFGEIRGLAIAA